MYVCILCISIIFTDRLLWYRRDGVEHINWSRPFPHRLLLTSHQNKLILGALDIVSRVRLVLCVLGPWSAIP